MPKVAQARSSIPLDEEVLKVNDQLTVVNTKSLTKFSIIFCQAFTDFGRLAVLESVE